MNYHLKSKPKNEHRAKIIIAVSIFVVLAALSFLLPNFTRNTSYTIARPVWYTSGAVKNFFVSIGNVFASKKTLVADNTKLEDEIASLKLKQVDYDTITAENEDLKTQLGRRGDSTRVPSIVLSKPPFSPYDTFVIDVGSNEGIQVGNRVYLSANTVIGTIKSVTSHTSIVELFSTNNIKEETVLSRTGATYIIIGQGGANYKLEVPKDTDILWGDMFEYPELNSVILASVYYIDTNSQSSFKTVYLRIPGNVFASKWVFVEKL